MSSWNIFQLLLFLVRADGMQVGAGKCRFIRSYCWFEGAVICSYSRSRIGWNAGPARFKGRSQHLTPPCFNERAKLSLHA